MAADGTDLMAMLKNMRINTATARVDRDWIKYGDLAGPFITNPSSLKGASSVAKMGGMEGYMKAPSASARLGSLQANPGMGCVVDIQQLQAVTGLPARSKVPKDAAVSPYQDQSGNMNLSAPGGQQSQKGDYGDDGKWYSEADWNKWNDANLKLAAAAAEKRAANRQPQVQASAEQPEDQGFQLEVDWTVPIANVQPGFFSTLAAAKVEDDAPLLSGSIPRAKLNLRYGMM